MSIPAIVMFCIALATMTPAHAYAAGYCDVAAYAGNQTLNVSDPALLAAIDQLSAENIEAHVIVLSSYDGQNEQQWLRQALNECPAWRGTDGDLRPRMFILTIATEDRNFDTHVGSGLRAKIDSGDEDWLHESVIKPEIRANADSDGNVYDTTPAVTAAFTAVKQLMTAVDPPPSQGGGSTQPDEPVDVPWGIIASIVIGLIAVIVVGFLVNAAVRSIRERRRARAELAKAISDAITAKQTALAATGDIIATGFDATKESCMLVLAAENGETATIAGEMAIAEQEFQALLNARDELGRMADPTTLNASVIVSEQAAHLGTLTEQLTQRLKHINELNEEYQQLMTSAQGRSEQLAQSLAATQQQVDALAGQGFRTMELDEQIDTVTISLEAARTSFGRGLYRAGHQSLQDAQDKLGEINETAEKLPVWAASIRTATGRLQKRLQGLRAKQTKTEAVYDQLCDEYGEQHLRDIEGFGSDADGHLDHAESLLAGIDAMIGMDRQDFSGAEKVLTEAKSAMDEGESLYQEAMDLKTALDRARANVGKLFGSVLQNLESAVDYCQRVRQDAGTDELEALLGLKGRLAELEAAAKAAQPDYRTIERQLNELQERIEDELGDAKSDYQAAEAQRQQIRDAEAKLDDALSDAERYYNNHRSDVKRSRLEELRRLRREPRGTDIVDYAVRLQVLRDLERSVGSVLRDSKQDVSNAAASRRSSISYPSTSSSSSRSSFGFGSGSSSSRSNFGSFSGHSSSKRGGW